MLDASIIIPSYNRIDSLRETLASLCHQSWPGEQFEVIVVDDGSSDNTGDIVREHFPFQLQYIHQANQGSAVARNTGARAAQGEVLIFLDDDMSVQPDYISGLLKEHQRFSRIVGMGTVRPYLPANPSAFARIHKHALDTEDLGPEGGFVDFTNCVTNNLSVERDDFFEIGMMQDVAGDGPTWWGDIDFGYRADKLGFAFRRSGEAICIHRDYSLQDLSTASKRAYKAALMAIPLFQKYPDLRPYIPMFADKTPISWETDSLSLKGRKLARRIASSSPTLWSLRKTVDLLETYYPSPAVLRPLYRWILGGYIFRGYQDGMRKYGLVVS